MSEKVFGPIKVTKDLEQLQKEADAVGGTAVGISGTGVLYKLVDGKPNKITPAEAAEILDVSVDIIPEIVAAKGVYELPSSKQEELVDEKEEKEEVLNEEKPEEKELPGEESEGKAEEEKPEETEHQETSEEVVKPKITKADVIEFLKNDEEFQEELLQLVTFLFQFEKV